MPSARQRHAEQTIQAVAATQYVLELAKQRQPVYNSLACGYRTPDNYCLPHGTNSLVPDSDGYNCGDCLERLTTVSEFNRADPQDDLPTLLLKPLSRKRIVGLEPDTFQLNSSIIRFDNATLLAYRKGWTRSNIWLAELDDSYNVLSNVQVDLPVTEYNISGSEDPRLFIHGKHLYLEFCGFQSGSNATRTNILYSAITPQGRVLFTCLPSFKARRHWEKNWSFFSYSDLLYAVYSIEPHIILRIEGDLAWVAHESFSSFPREIGWLRGGSSPYLFDGEWYCFTHNVFRYKDERWYSLGCYTFENEPPFRPTRFLPGSLLLPTSTDRPEKHVPHCVFPCGAYQTNDRWIVSYGYYDRYCEIVEYDVAELESQLVSI